MKRVLISLSQESHVSEREQYVCLCEREDIPLLVCLFLPQICREVLSASSWHKQEVRNQKDLDN